MELRARTCLGTGRKNLCRAVKCGGRGFTSTSSNAFFSTLRPGMLCGLYQEEQQDVPEQCWGPGLRTPACVRPLLPSLARSFDTCLQPRCNLVQKALIAPELCVGLAGSSSRRGRRHPKAWPLPHLLGLGTSGSPACISGSQREPQHPAVSWRVCC